MAYSWKFFGQIIVMAPGQPLLIFCPKLSIRFVAHMIESFKNNFKPR